MSTWPGQFPDISRSNLVDISFSFNQSTLVGQREEGLLLNLRSVTSLLNKSLLSSVNFASENAGTVLADEIMEISHLWLILANASFHEVH